MKLDNSNDNSSNSNAIDSSNSNAIDNISEIVSLFKEHNINLTPAGIWELDDTCKKVAKEPHRVHNLEWSDYLTDNLAKHVLTNDTNILVLDIDDSPTTLYNNNDIVVCTHSNDIEVVESSHSPELNNTIKVLDMQIPVGLMTQTTRKGSYHIYYSITSEQAAQIPPRIVKLLNSNVDIFRYGTIFEAHTFSPNYRVLNQDLGIPPLPTAVVDKIVEHCDTNNVTISDSTSQLLLNSNINRYNLVTAYLEGSLTNKKQWNSFFKSIMPKEYIRSNARKLQFSDFKVSYDLINKIAVKLTTTQQLGYEQHVIPTLYKLLNDWGIDPMSHKSQSYLYKNILPSLPQHDPLTIYNESDDLLTLNQHCVKQSLTDYPLFRTIQRGKMAWIEVDKYTLRPRSYQGEFILDSTAAKALHQELNITNEEGRTIGWDDSHLPILITVNSPYKPQYYIDDDDRHVLNLYTPTKYIMEAEATATIPDNNVFYRAMYSTIGAEYLPVVLAYHAQVVFGDSSPVMVLWVAALQTEKGGTGKSMATLEIPSLLLGAAASSIDVKTMSSGWGDTISSSKLISLEDIPQVSEREWKLLYAIIKQQSTSSYRKLNMKHGSIQSERVSIAISGSSNHRPPLSASDRRFLCLEPAHLHGITEPLTQEEATHLTEIMNSHSYCVEAQEYANYLLYIYNTLTSEQRRWLFIEAPETIYRNKWILSGVKPTQAIIQALPYYEELTSLVKTDHISDDINAQLTDYYRFIVAIASEQHRVSLPWEWFKGFVPYVMSDAYASNDFSKSNLAKMLEVDFTNPGVYATSRYTDKNWLCKVGLPPHWSSWAMSAYSFIISEEELLKFKENLI